MRVVGAASWAVDSLADQLEQIVPDPSEMEKHYLQRLDRGKVETQTAFAMMASVLYNWRSIMVHSMQELGA